MTSKIPKVIVVVTVEQLFAPLYYTLRNANSPLGLVDLCGGRRILGVQNFIFYDVIIPLK